ncbi:MAG: hypothetical protein WBA74_08290 [Cyclobacteriaceae bacterium]
MIYFEQMERNLVIENLYFIPLILSAVVSLRTFRKDWPIAIRFIAAYLLVTAFIEVFAALWKGYLHDTPWWIFKPYNHWIYNLGIVIRYPLVFAYFSEYLPGRRSRALLVSISFVALLVNLLFGQGLHQFNSYSVLFSFFLILLLCFWFFRYILIRKDIVNLMSATEFWITAGLFFYHAATLPLFFIINALNSQSALVANTFFLVNDPLYFIMHTFLTIAFLCTPKFLH